MTKRKTLSIALVFMMIASMFAFMTTVNAASYKWPVPGHKKVSAKFGPQRNANHTDYHYGIDISAPTGSKIVAARAGTVVKIYKGTYGSYGNVTIIKHKDGWHTFYAHQNKIYVKKGQRVSKGKVIGTVGKTGRTYGPCLHFELIKGKYEPYAKNRVNPIKYLK